MSSHSDGFLPPPPSTAESARMLLRKWGDVFPISHRCAISGVRLERRDVLSPCHIHPPWSSHGESQFDLESDDIHSVTPRSAIFTRKPRRSGGCQDAVSRIIGAEIMMRLATLRPLPLTARQLPLVNAPDVDVNSRLSLSRRGVRLVRRKAASIPTRVETKRRLRASGNRVVVVAMTMPTGAHLPRSAERSASPGTPNAATITMRKIVLRLLAFQLDASAIALGCFLHPV